MASRDHKPFSEVWIEASERSPEGVQVVEGFAKLHKSGELKLLVYTDDTVRLSAGDVLASTRAVDSKDLSCLAHCEEETKRYAVHSRRLHESIDNARKTAHSKAAFLGVRCRGKKGAFQELFSGSGLLTQEVQGLGLLCMPAVEKYDLRGRIDPSCDLENGEVIEKVCRQIRQGVISFVHMSPDCKSFSGFMKNNGGTRTADSPQGVHPLLDSEISGNLQAQSCSRVAHARLDSGAAFVIEQPAPKGYPTLFDQPCMESVSSRTGVEVTSFLFCTYNHRPVGHSNPNVFLKKNIYLLHGSCPGIRSLARRCPGASGRHIHWTDGYGGWGSINGVPVAQSSAQYPIDFCKEFARVVKESNLVRESRRAAANRSFLSMQHGFDPTKDGEMTKESKRERSERLFPELRRLEREERNRLEEGVNMMLLLETRTSTKISLKKLQNQKCQSTSRAHRGRRCQHEFSNASRGCCGVWAAWLHAFEALREPSTSRLMQSQRFRGLFHCRNLTEID